MRGFCNHCQKNRVLATELCMQDYVIKGEVYTVPVAVAICPHCLNIVPFPTLDRHQRLAACNAYRSAHGLLTGSQIVAARTIYGLSQRGMARILGWGPITIHRYEQGGIQNRAHDTVLRLAASDPSFMLRRLELVKATLTPLGYRRLRYSIDMAAERATKRATERAANMAAGSPLAHMSSSAAASPLLPQ